LVAKNADGKTLLHIAAECGYTQIAEKLIEEEASLNVKDLNGCSPLHLAVANGHIETVFVLIDYNEMNLNATDHSGRTALHRAVQKRNATMVEILINSGADLNIKDHVQTHIPH
jgi:ankyrin repeat protein